MPGLKLNHVSKRGSRCKKIILNVTCRPVVIIGNIILIPYHPCRVTIARSKIGYRQMGELWTLFEFACLQNFTCSMMVEMDGNISRVSFCSTIFSKSKLNGMIFGKTKRKNIAGQSYPSIWGNFEHLGETLDGRLLCTSNDLEWLTFM